MSNAEEICEHVLAKFLYDDVGQPDVPEEGELGGGEGHGAMADTGVHLLHHLQVCEGEALQLHAVMGDSHQVLAPDQGVGAALHVKPGDPPATHGEEVLESGFSFI